MKSELLIVIPAYNEEENIENEVTFIKNKYSQYDYIVVNDGSKDRQRIFLLLWEYFHKLCQLYRNFWDLNQRLIWYI